MNCLLQRVSYAKVKVNGRVVGQIDRGLLVFAGVEKQDDQNRLKQMARKIIQYRVFSDVDGKMNLSVQDVQGDILLVSQFTLAADTRKGLRPSFSSAAGADISQPLFAQLADEISHLYKPPQTGLFGADMQVSLCNDGPVSFVLNL